MRKLLTLLLCVVMVVCMMPGMAWADAMDSDMAGSQTASDWSTNPDTSWYNANDVKPEYTLTTVEQLAGFFSLLKDRRNGTNFGGITIKLGNDIVLNDVTDANWTESAIKWDGKAAKAANYFAGTFDGCGYSIIGLYSETGLFAELNGTVQDLTIDTAAVSGQNVFYVGAIVGEANTNSKISGCTVKNSVIAEGKGPLC